MSARVVAIVLAGGRAAFGLGLLFYPSRVARGWIGDEIDRPATRMIVQAAGARDFVLGAGGVIALLRGHPAQGWITAGVAADSADFALTAVNFSKLPHPGRLATMALTGVAAVAGIRLVPKLKA